MKFRSFSAFSAEVLLDLFTIHRYRAISFEVLLKQILFTGVQAVWLTLLLALLLGALIIVEGYQFLFNIGQTEWIYKGLIFAMVRDLGPFIVSFIVLARSGTAITTELGYMVVGKEVDALMAMGISPITYLVTPRVVGMVLSMVLLMSYFLISGIFGGFLISNLFQNIPFLDFLGRLLGELRLLDIFVMLFKVGCCGLMISLISCYHGLTVIKAMTEVPQRNIKAVGRSVIAVCMVNLFGTLMYLGMRGF